MFSLALKSLLNRRFVSFLTIATIALSVVLILGVDRLRTEARASFANSADGIDLIVASRGNSVQILMATVFGVGSTGNALRYETLEAVRELETVDWAVPISMGDNYQGYPVIGTNESYFEHFRHSGGTSLSFEAGRAFSGAAEAVLGAEVAKRFNYGLGEELILAHGSGDVSFHLHDDEPFAVVGVLEATGTAVDRMVLVSLKGFDSLHSDDPTEMADPLGQLLPAAGIAASATAPTISESSVPAQKAAADEGRDHDDHDHEGRDHEGHDHDEHDHDGHDHEGHDHDEHDHEGHDHEGHDHDEHDHEGHDHDEHDHEGHDHEGHDHDEHDHEGHDHEGHDHDEHDHEGHDHEGHDHDEHDHEGHDHEGHDHDEHEAEQINAIYLGLKDRTAVLGLQQYFAQYTEEPLTAVMPNVALLELWSITGTAEAALSLMAMAVALAGMIGLLATLSAALEARRREFSVLRSVGATPWRIFSLIVMEAVLLTSAGLLLGYGVLMGATALLDPILASEFGLRLGGLWPSQTEWVLMGAIFVAGLVASLIPAYRVYRITLSDGLSSGH